MNVFVALLIIVAALVLLLVFLHVLANVLLQRQIDRRRQQDLFDAMLRSRFGRGK